MTTTRKIEFKIGIGSSPAALAELKKFGDQVRAEQKKLWESSATFMAKSMRDGLNKVQGDALQNIKREQKERVASVRGAANDIQKIHERAEAADYKFRRDLQKKAIAEEQREFKAMQDWKSRVRANSIALELKENARLRREGAANENVRRLAQERRYAGYGRAIGGAGSVLRGAAYSGLIGEENQQTVLNTLLGVEAAGSIYRGGMDIAKGLRGAGAMGGLAGGAAGLGGIASAAAPLAAGLAALTGAVLGTVSALGAMRDVSEYGVGKGSKYGSYNDWMGTKMASGVMGMADMVLPKSLKSRMAEDDGFFSGPLGAMFAARRAESQKDSYRDNINAYAGNLGSLGRSRLEGIGDDVAKGRAALMASATDYRNTTAGGARNDATRAATENFLAIEDHVVKLMREQYQTAVRTAKERVQGSQTELDNIKRSHAELKEMAAAAKRDLGSDLSRAGLASPEDQSRLREIDRKRKAGENLSREETEFAGGFNEFEGLAQSNAERMARQAGLEGIFSEGKTRAEQAAAAAAESAKSVAAAELTVKQQVELLVKVEGDEQMATALDKALQEVKDQILAERARAERVMTETVEKSQRAYANSHQR